MSRSSARWFIGKSTTSRRFSSPQSSMTMRSMPGAMPPCGGAPPHGGSAPGIDRIVRMIADEPDLREVILFPMNQRAEDLLMGAPSEVTPKQLRELNIRLALPAKGE